ncbi:hypothetical protein KFZ58_02850 [Virgibacillus sp. NKC19-16]|uniref:hypothetical protein n=1 Tax=Virgibacillus salidurans TaxID=2831673 RepID=UPI001F2C156F|nr:hypothetical protein [Virgibacillus sp. NKC19-16]UJL46902.1 hypothetical protein KFZ58_02850 [Virgibacillus sp. NKC19-16]
MKNINSPEELYEEMDKLDKRDSVTQFSVQGKGNFTLVYQGKDTTVEEEIESDEELKKMVHESLAAYERGDYQTTSGLLKSLSKKEF